LSCRAFPTATGQKYFLLFASWLLVEQQKQKKKKEEKRKIN
jgi:hypothetical protein